MAKHEPNRLLKSAIAFKHKKESEQGENKWQKA
jgi:hypothetical protein